MRECPRMRQRVRGVVDLEQVIGRDVGVALRRRERRVTEELLDRAEIGAAVEQVRRARVAERVGMEICATGVERAAAGSKPSPCNTASTRGAIV